MTTAPRPAPIERPGGAALLLRMTRGACTTQTVYALASLGLPDLLATGPRTSADLATATGAHEATLHRLLRACCAFGLLQQQAEGAFALAPLGAWLRSDVPGSLRAWALWSGGPRWPIWGGLLASVRTGESARPMDAGAFAQLEDPATAELFHQAMAGLTTLMAPALVAACDLRRFGSVLDVGGGHGALLIEVLRAWPHLRGRVLDLPHAEAGARQALADAGLADRSDFVAGSFFETIPASEAILLKTIVHDWPDAEAVTLLSRCREALAAHGRLFVVDMVLPERMEMSPSHEAAAASDLNMLVSLGASERTEAQLRDLLTRAGLEVERLTPTAWGTSVVEARPQ